MTPRLPTPNPAPPPPPLGEGLTGDAVGPKEAAGRHSGAHARRDDFISPPLAGTKGGALLGDTAFVSVGGDGGATTVSEVGGGLAALPGLTGFAAIPRAGTAAAGVAGVAPVWAPWGDVDLCDPCLSGESRHKVAIGWGESGAYRCTTATSLMRKSAGYAVFHIESTSIGAAFKSETCWEIFGLQ